MRVGLPDVETALSAERSPLNPHWFPLGSALIYALALIRSVAEPFTDWGAMDLRFGRSDAGRPGGHCVGGADVRHRTPDVRRLDGPVGSGSHRLCRHPYPARPFLPAGTLHRAHVVGGVVGHAPVHGHPAYPRRRAAGPAGGLGHGAQGVGGAHPGSAGAGVPLDLEGPRRRPVGRPDGVGGGEICSGGRAGGVAGPGGVFHHHPVCLPGLQRVSRRHPGPDGDGPGGGSLALHLAIRRHAGLLVSDPADLGLGPGLAAGHCRLAGRSVHRVDGMARRVDAAFRSPSAGVGSAGVRLPGAVRGQVPALCLPAHAVLRADGCAHDGGLCGVGAFAADGGFARCF